MFKDSQKIAISKHFLIPLLFIVLIFTSFGVAMDGNYAVDVNQTDDGIGSELNVEDKLENSQENSVTMNSNENEVLEVNQNENILGATLRLNNGGTFSDIKEKVRLANPGDTIVLNGIFTASGASDQIIVDKALRFTSENGATLNAKGKTHIFVVKNTASNSSFNKLKLMNGYRASPASAIHIMAKNVKITNCIFENNFAYKGGAIFTTYDDTTAENLYINNCQFIKNHAQISAGAVGAFGNNTRVSNCIFDGNYITNPDVNGLYGGALQVGLDNVISVATVNKCKFYNNHVDSYGSGAHGGAGCVRNGTVYKNCIFINNTANQGGAITYHASGLIKNCTFINNTAFKYGGAVSTGFFANSMDLGFEDCNFEGNTAPLGGAVQLMGENINISNCNFDKNHASQDGGAINIEAVTVNIVNSEFNDNSVNRDGGAIYIKGEQATIKDCSFNSNVAIPDVNELDDGLGGAIYINSTNALVENNEFYYNTARNGSAIYYDKSGNNLKLRENVMYKNQAWVYSLPIYAEDIYYGESENFGSVIHGGNNIAEYRNLAISNAIYNAASNNNIEIDGETPVLGATTSGRLYQDDREYNMDILLTVTYEDGSVVYNKTLNSNCFGEVSDTLNNLKVGNYFVTAKHFEDTYYKGISNVTSFSVTAKVDDRIRKSVSSEPINYGDIVIWTLNITNNGPSNATGVIVRDVLPEGLIWLEDDSDGAYNPENGTWTIDFLEVGEVIIINIKTTIDKTGNIVNNANITANEYDWNLTNNHDESEINVEYATDLAIVKQVNESNPNYGDLVRWTLTVTNYGPDVAHDVVVVDVLPSSLEFVGPSGSYDVDNGVWNVGTLDKGSSASLDIVCRVKATGIIENVASVSGHEYDYNESNNQDSDFIDVNSSSDLAIVKVANVSAANFGDLVKWTLTVTNNGPDKATGIHISDILPNGFEYVSSTKPCVDGVIGIEGLAVGGHVTVDIVSRVIATGGFVNVANVSGNEYDWNLSNNKDDASVFINPAADLGVVKTVNNSNPNYGDLIKWTLTVTNYGPDVAHDVVVVDVLPDSLEFVGPSGSYDVDSGVWNVGTLDKGSSASLDIVCRVKATGIIKNMVSVSGHEYDYNKSNNNDSEVIDVNSSSDLAIVKVANVSVADFGDLVKWTLTVTNNGPDAANGVKITDVLPKGFEYVSSTKPCVDGVIGIEGLAVGGHVAVDIVSRVIATGGFVNVANVSGNEYDWNLSNNKDDASVLINPATDLVVVKHVNNSNPNYGDLVKWTLTVINNGPDVAHDVVVVDVLPSSLEFVGPSGSYDVDSGVWNIGTLDNGSSVSLDIICRVNATGLFTNHVSVSGHEYDYNKTNNYDNESISVANASDLGIVKLVNSSRVNYGQLVKWTIIATNYGPDNATGVYVEEILPEGLILINHTASKGIYDNGLWSICCIERGASQKLELICKVNKTGLITNFANITGNEYDPNLSNNDDNNSISVPLSSDIAVVKDVNNSNPYYGDIIEWSITVTNNGPDDSADVFVIERLPEELELLSYECTRGSYDEDMWYIDYLANGASENLLIRCVVKALGDVENIVNVIPSQYDWNETNNNDSEIISADPLADLSIIKLVNASNANYLDLIKWTLIVSNNGPNDATEVFVSDVIPNGLEIVRVSGGEYDNSIWNVGDLKNGQSKQLHIVCKVKATGEFVNAANVWASETDPDLSNNEDENYLSVAPASDLSITKTVSKYRYNVGDVVKYSIKLTNKGPDCAENVEVREVMDDSLQLKSFRASYGDFDKVNDVWSLDELNVGESAFLKINAIASKAGNARNNVSVTSDNFDPDLSNNNDTISVNIVKNNKNDNISKNEMSHYSKIGHNGYSASVLKKNISGNPFMVIVLLFVFSLGAFYANNIFKKR